jgi:ribosomal protein L11 methyltransferase
MDTINVGLVEVKWGIDPTKTDWIDDVLLEHGIQNWSILEDAITRKAWIVGIFPSKADAERESASLSELLGEFKLEKSEQRLLPDCDWKESYKVHFKAWQFGHLHWVPIWEKENFKLPKDNTVLWLDPGLAFGTGNHETTRLCIERLIAYNSSLDEVLRKKKETLRVIDAGCGSGILALSAALLGFCNIYGFDLDPEAVRVSFENADLNDLTGRVPFKTAGLEDGLLNEKADVLLANIQADVLMRYATVLTQSVANGGVLILSGILALERDAVLNVFNQTVPTWHSESKIMGEWSDILLVKP